MFTYYTTKDAWRDNRQAIKQSWHHRRHKKYGIRYCYQTIPHLLAAMGVAAFISVNTIAV